LLNENFNPQYQLHLYMNRNTLRIIIVLAAISIVGIAITQVYWVRKAFDLKENQFNHDVQSSLTAVADRISEMSKTVKPGNSPVKQMATNYFVVHINEPINFQVLGVLISSEFEKRKVSADYEYGIYDCEEKCMTATNFSTHSKSKATVSLEEMPTLKEDSYYFAVRFSRIEANLISQMGIWIYTSAVMLVVIFFFVYTLLVIFKQKLLSEIQKDFINNMTHEFKTPLSTIAISSEALRSPSIINQPERLLNYATIIQTESQRLKQHVERVLQMAKLEKSDIALRKEKLDLHELINDAVQNSSLLLHEKNGKIDLQLSATQHCFIGDKLHFTNVLFNLIDNAIKYNKRQPQLTIVTKNEKRNIIIEVKDNGIGISAENLKKIFHQFYRVPTGNLHDIKGFGLGLNYVKLIIEAHRGKISVNSELSKGSTFKIILPTA